MNTILGLLSAASSGIICGALVWAILSERINDLIIVKVGMILMALGFAAVATHSVQELMGADTGAGLVRSVLLINAGLAVLAVGVATRMNSSDPNRRWFTDWGNLDTRPAHDAES